MAFNLAAAANVLKTRYVGTLREQLNNATVLLSKIGRQDQKVSGKDFTVPLHIGRNSSAGRGIADGADLPTAGQQSYATTIVPNKYLYGRITITGPTIAATRDNVGAFVQAIDSEVEGLMRDFKRDMNRQLNGVGDGALGYWVGADDTTGALVDDGIGTPLVHLPTGTTTVDIMATADGTTERGADIPLARGAASATSVAVTWGSGSVSGTADNDVVIYANTAGQEMMGIAGIIDDGDPHALAGGALQGLAVASNGFWKAQVKGAYASPVAIDFADMQEVIDMIATQSDYGEDDIKFLFSNYPVRRAYFKLAAAERRTVNRMDLDGGFKGVDFSGIPWVVDSQARRQTIFYIVPDTMKIYRTSDFDWMERDGSYLSRVANKDAYEAVLFHFGNLACETRNGNGVLKGVVEA